MNLSEDQILLLAPDAASGKAGKDLAHPAKWVTKGANDLSLWGECQGSGSKPYQTAIDLPNTAFKCSCPSRKFPCKHGLGLALLHARQPAAFTFSKAPPPWVTEWIAKRSGNEEKKAAPLEKPVDEAAQLKRQQAREQKVLQGTEELLLWIKDLVRNGMVNVPEKGDAYWNATAKRLVDAQAPGLASMVKSLGKIPFYQEGWQTAFIHRLTSIYLVVQGYRNQAAQPPALQQDIRALIGFVQPAEELNQHTGVTDTWLVLGKQLQEEDNLTVERNWLYGIQSNRYAVVLQFLVSGQGGKLVLTPGTYLAAALVYYPSSTPMRALLSQQVNTLSLPLQSAYADWNSVVKMQTALYAQLPVQAERPFIIDGLTPVRYRNQWWLKDGKGHLMQVKEAYAGIWKLLALSGGDALPVAVIGKESVYEPIGVWHQHQYKLL